MRRPKSTAVVVLLASMAIELILFLGLLLSASQRSAENHAFHDTMVFANIAGAVALYTLPYSMSGVSHALKAIVHGGVVFVVQVAVIWLIIMGVVMIVRKCRRW